MTYEDPCCNPDLVTITNNAGTPSLTDAYTGASLTFFYGANPFTVEPSICNLSVVCEGVSPANSNVPCKDLDAKDQLSWSFDSSLYTDKVNGIAPGTYTYTYSVQTCSTVSKPLLIPITLTDPCLDVTV